MLTITRPQSDEYAVFYAGYVSHVPEGADLLALYAEQPTSLNVLVGGLSEEQAATPHKPGEWSIKQILGHINDTERIMAYRTLRIARGDTTPLAAFDQDPYVAATDFNARTLQGLLEEFAALRNANLLGFRVLTEAEIDRRGTVSDHLISVRALLYIMPGHVSYHIESIKVDYAL